MSLIVNNCKMMKQIKNWLFGNVIETPTNKIDEVNTNLDKLINSLTSTDSKFKYLYFYFNSISKNEKQNLYEEILSKLNDSEKIIKEVKECLN